MIKLLSVYSQRPVAFIVLNESSLAILIVNSVLKKYFCFYGMVQNAFDQSHCRIYKSLISVYKKPIDLH